MTIYMTMNIGLGWLDDAIDTISNPRNACLTISSTGWSRRAARSDVKFEFWDDE